MMNLSENGELIQNYNELFSDTLYLVIMLITHNYSIIVNIILCKRRMKNMKKVMVLVEQTEDVYKVQFLLRLNMTQIVAAALQEYVENHKDLVEKYDKLIGGVPNED